MKIYYISCKNDPDITHTKIIFGLSGTFLQILMLNLSNSLLQ